MSKILEALNKLDVGNDNHWTSEGLPRIDTVRMLAADQSISREDITKEAPEFTRQSVLAQAEAAAGQGTATEQEQAGDCAAAVTEQAPETTDTDSVEQGEQDYDSVIEEARAALNVAVLALNEAQTVVNQRQAALDDAINAKYASGQVESNMDAIQGYLRSSAEQIKERGRRARVLTEHGVTAADIINLIPQASPIDQALARKR